MSLSYFDIILRIITFCLCAALFIYWRITEKQTEKIKPKKNYEQTVYLFGKYALETVFKLFLLLQLVGLVILPMHLGDVAATTFKLLGLLFVMAGTFVAISARKTIGDNWTHAFEYQVKQKHQLVTSGVYRFIRHPIYTGLFLMFIGLELLVQSNCVYFGLLLLPFAIGQMKNEEKLLTKHFGKAYTAYQKHSKMFLPFLW